MLRLFKISFSTLLYDLFCMITTYVSGWHTQHFSGWICPCHQHCIKSSLLNPIQYKTHGEYFWIRKKIVPSTFDFLLYGLYKISGWKSGQCVDLQVRGVYINRQVSLCFSQLFLHIFFRFWFHVINILMRGQEHFL